MPSTKIRSIDDTEAIVVGLGFVVASLINQVGRSGLIAWRGAWLM
jgi:hypothetical protein